MIINKLPYRVTVAVATDTCVSRTIILGRYGTLSAAIAAASRRDSVVPDGTMCISLGARVVRSVYHHGRAATWRP